MLIVLISWIYIFIVSLIAGMAVNRLLGKIISVPEPDSKSFGLTGIVVTGLTALTVYAETFSIFYKIGAICHLIMLLAVALSAYVWRKELLSVFKGITSTLTRNKIIIFAVIILAAAFFTSRGKFHTDTGIYHAQAIRILEEYGVIKGLGNFQLHFAYNSAYLALCALFTMSFILPTALHTMTGFFMVLFTCYAVNGLMEYKAHKRHGGDFARIAILIYALTVMTGLQSPATDYGTMFMVLYILAAWISFAEEQEQGPYGAHQGTLTDTPAIAMYGYLAVLSIFTVSMKLSAALIVILAILPAVMLIRRKRWKEFGAFILIGFISFLPYLVRNVILSGWLFYPVDSIDLFNVVWKIPVEYMKEDAAQIKAWARCLYDITRLDEGVSSWLPIWWEEKQHYEEMLIYSQVMGTVLLIYGAICRALKRSGMSPAVILFYITIFLNIAMWFMTAPFIRYGLAFLLLLPLCAIGDNLDLITGSKKSIIVIALSAIITINFFSWIDNYFTDDSVFIKHYVADGYYLSPVPFEEAEMTPIDMNGQTVYVSAPTEVNSYYVCPGTCYEDMAYRSELIGSTIKEGFKAK